MTTKQCYTCRQTKPLECFSFAPRVGGRSVPRRDCKACRNKQISQCRGVAHDPPPPEPLVIDGFLPMPLLGERRALVASL